MCSARPWRARLLARIQHDDAPGLAALCAELDCQPGDILEFDPTQPMPEDDD